VSDQIPHPAQWDALKRLLQADQEAQKRVRQAEEQAEKTLHDAREQAESVVDKARREAESEADRILEEAFKEVEQKIKALSREGAVQTLEKGLSIPDGQALRRRTEGNIDVAADFLGAWVMAQETEEP
jgi:V/A-type H+-transporting ATPase subunit G/H